MLKQDKPNTMLITPLVWPVPTHKILLAMPLRLIRPLRLLKLALRVQLKALR